MKGSCAGHTTAAVLPLGGTGRSFIVTQPVKKLFGTIKTAIFNDYGYRLLSNDKSVSTEALKAMDKADETNLELDCVHYRPKDLNRKIKKIL